MRANVLAMSQAAGYRGKPLKRESRTWLSDETSWQGAQRSKPLRVWETLRADRRQGFGNPAVCGFCVL